MEKCLNAELTGNDGSPEECIFQVSVGEGSVSRVPIAGNGIATIGTYMGALFMLGRSAGRLPLCSGNASGVTDATFITVPLTGTDDTWEFVNPDALSRCIASARFFWSEAVKLSVLESAEGRLGVLNWESVDRAASVGNLPAAVLVDE